MLSFCRQQIHTSQFSRFLAKQLRKTFKINGVQQLRIFCKRKKDFLKAIQSPIAYQKELTKEA
jgi:predicted GTPase